MWMYAPSNATAGPSPTPILGIATEGAMGQSPSARFLKLADGCVGTSWEGWMVPQLNSEGSFGPFEVHVFHLPLAIREAAPGGCGLGYLHIDTDS